MKASLTPFVKRSLFGLCLTMGIGTASFAWREPVRPDCFRPRPPQFAPLPPPVVIIPPAPYTPPFYTQPPYYNPPPRPVFWHWHQRHWRWR